MRGVWGRNIAAGRILRGGPFFRLGGLFPVRGSFHRRRVGNQAHSGRFPLDFRGKIPRVHDEAVPGERPEGEVFLNQLRQQPLRVQWRQPNQSADFGGFGRRGGGREAEGAAQLVGGAVNGHGFVEYEVVGRYGVDDSRRPGVPPAIQQRRGALAAQLFQQPQAQRPVVLAQEPAAVIRDNFGKLAVDRPHLNGNVHHSCVRHRNCAAKPTKLSMDSAEIEHGFRAN